MTKDAVSESEAEADRSECVGDTRETVRPERNLTILRLTRLVVGVPQQERVRSETSGSVGSKDRTDSDARIE